MKIDSRGESRARVVRILPILEFARLKIATKNQRDFSGKLRFLRRVPPINRQEGVTLKKVSLYLTFQPRNCATLRELVVKSMSPCKLRSTSMSFLSRSAATTSYLPMYQFLLHFLTSRDVSLLLPFLFPLPSLSFGHLEREKERERERDDFFPSFLTPSCQWQKRKGIERERERGRVRCGGDFLLP